MNRRTRWLSLERLESRNLLATLIVNSLADIVDANDDVMTLREAVQNSTVSESGEVTTIQFDESLIGGTIQLTQGAIAIDHGVTIMGPGSGLLTIDVSASDPTPNQALGDGDRAFDIGLNDAPYGTNSRVELSGLSVSGGDVADNGGGIRFGPWLDDGARLRLLDVSVANSSAGYRGGGIYAGGGNVHIRNVALDGNSAEEGGGLAIAGTSQLSLASVVATNNNARKGGGIMLSSPFKDTDIHSVTATNNRAHYGGGLAFDFDDDDGDFDLGIRSSSFMNNMAQIDGGGLHIFIGEFSDPGDFELSGVRIDNNTANNDGGGIWMVSDDGPLPLRVHSSNITGNMARNGGGALVQIRTRDQFTVSYSKFESNLATERGGGLHFTVSNEGISPGTQSTTTIDSSSFDANRSEEGGGLYMEQEIGEVVFSRSTLSRNEATIGGGTYLALGALADADLIDSTLSGNRAETGGGAYVVKKADAAFTGQRLRVEQSTVTDNHALQGGGVVTHEILSYVHNSILANNTDTTGTAPEFWSMSANGVPVDSFSYSLIGNNLGTGFAESELDGLGNQIGGTVSGVLDPQLEPLADNGGAVESHLPMRDSPAIDMGDADFILPRDLRSVKRIPGIVDMGAIETGNRPIVDLDYNGDGELDCSDYSMIFELVAMGTTPTTPDTVRFDLVLDGRINSLDSQSWVGRASRILFGSTRSPDGDANLDGRIDALDLNVVGANWQQTPKGWCHGDFNNDLIVDARDLNEISLHWQTDLASNRAPKAALPVAAVDEVMAAKAVVRKDLTSSDERNSSSSKDFKPVLVPQRLRAQATSAMRSRRLGRTASVSLDAAAEIEPALAQLERPMAALKSMASGSRAS